MDMAREETISEGLARLGYTHRRVAGSSAHAIEKDGKLVGYMHAHQAAALVERETHPSPVAA